MAEYRRQVNPLTVRRSRSMTPNYYASRRNYEFFIIIVASSGAMI
jgi:hypothetical protein